MDTKWKNFSRQIVTWSAVIVILIVSVFSLDLAGECYFQARAAQQRYSYLNVGESLERNSTFEESLTYQELCHEIGRALLCGYLESGKWGTYSKDSSFSEKVNVSGVLTTQKGAKQKIQIGNEIKKNKKNHNRIYSFTGQVDTVIEENNDGGSKENSKTYYDLQTRYYDTDGKWMESGTHRSAYQSDLKEGKRLSKIKNMEFSIEIPKKTYEEVKAQWLELKYVFYDALESIFVAGVIAFISLLVLLFVVRKEEEGKFGKWFDALWLEFQLAIFIGLVMLLVAATFSYFACMEYQLIDVCSYLSVFVILCLELSFLYLLISFVRKLKARELFSSSVICKAWKTTFTKLREQKLEWDFWQDKNSSILGEKNKELEKKKVSMIAVIVIGVMVTGILLFHQFLLGIIVGVVTYVLYRKMLKDYEKEVQNLLDLEKLLQQIYEISNGNFKAQTDIGNDSLYFKATNDLKDIGLGMERSVEQQLKGEKMKIDLITNVSHDLKTPLTSIISYVDLLSKDESLSDEAKDYVAILSKKSERLKNIVTDLFDLAKTTSGNATVDLSKMNLKKLVEQTLIEMGDYIEESGFEIITEYESDELYFMADSNRMYRVVQNVMENALKYSLRGSRIYIKVDEIDARCRLSIKNTASYRMKFTEEEILERFTRGDQARTTEGSGLGLSIADSFTKLCGGSLHVKISGDQFKVEISFPKETK